MKYVAIITLLVTTSAFGRGSTITSSRPTTLTTKAAKKRNFKADIVAVTQAHDTWKKAHLNATLYTCQRNSERVATLAKKVSDRIEASKKDAVASAKAVEKTVTSAMGNDATDLPENFTDEQLTALKAKADKLAKAKKQADLLERLAGQVAHFYQYDMPKESAVDGNCVADYRAAMSKGVAAAVQYHSDAEAMSAKLDKLSQAVEAAISTATMQSKLASR